MKGSTRTRVNKIVASIERSKALGDFKETRYRLKVVRLLGGKLVFCTVPECDKQVAARDLCSKHYTQWYTRKNMVAPTVRYASFLLPVIGVDRHIGLVCECRTRECYHDERKE